MDKKFITILSGIFVVAIFLGIFLSASQTLKDSLGIEATGFAIITPDQPASVGLNVIASTIPPIEPPGGKVPWVPPTVEPEIPKFDEIKKDGAKLSIIEISSDGGIIYENGIKDPSLTIFTDEKFNLKVTLKNVLPATLHSVSVSVQGEADVIYVEPALQNFLLENKTVSFDMKLDPRTNISFKLRVIGNSNEASDYQDIIINFEEKKQILIELPVWSPPYIALTFLGLLVLLILLYFFVIKKLSNNTVFNKILMIARKTYFADERLVDEIVKSKKHIFYKKIYVLDDTAKKFESVKEIKSISPSDSELKKAVLLNKQYNLDYRFCLLISAAADKFSPCILTDRKLPKQLKLDLSNIVFEDPFAIKDIDQKLTEYIRLAKKKKISSDMIRERLIQIGWREDLVDLALKNETK